MMPPPCPSPPVWALPGLLAAKCLPMWCWQSGKKSIEALVDIGEDAGVYCQAEVPDASRVFIDIGGGIAPLLSPSPPLSSLPPSLYIVSFPLDRLRCMPPLAGLGFHVECTLEEASHPIGNAPTQNASSRAKSATPSLDSHLLVSQPSARQPYRSKQRS